MKTLKLFCLPYAGGSASVYNPWKDHLDRSIQLVPVELAGRGSRIKEPLNTSRKEAVDDIYQIIRSDIENHPYMIFGHSMGALMTFDLVHKIKVNNMPIPRHLFFSGASAPHLRDEKKKYHLMSPEEFEKEVRNLGGTPPEFFQHQELIDMFLPILKNDFKMAET
ncbi:MAG: thioesterase domain-containing protein, partial [Bacteroidota bacterium]